MNLKSQMFLVNRTGESISFLNYLTSVIKPSKMQNLV